MHPDHRQPGCNVIRAFTEPRGGTSQGYGEAARLHFGEFARLNFPE
jgi:hypothetical protein